MPNAVAPQEEGRGSLSGIADATTRREIEKLWGYVEGLRGTNPRTDSNVATMGDLRATESSLLQKIGSGTVTQGGPTIVGGDSISSGGGFDLRPLDNVWTGQNIYRRLSTAVAATMMLVSLNSGAITPASGPTIMLEPGATAYSTVLDIRRTTQAQGEAGTHGGTAAAYIQHRVNATTATATCLNSGLRVQLESWQGAAVGTVNDAVAGYFSIYNHGFNSGGFGLHVDAYHAGTGNTVTYGVDVELFREFLDGKTIGFHARATGDSPYGNPNDWAFLASPQSGGSGRFRVVYGAGSNFIGQLPCDIGLDLGYATCAQFAVVLPANRWLLWNGPSTAVTPVKTRFNELGWIEWRLGETNTFRIDNSGRIHAWGGLALNNEQLIGGDAGIGFSTLNWDYPGVLSWKLNGSEAVGFTNNGTPRFPNIPTYGLDAALGLAGYRPEIVQGTLVLIPYFTPNGAGGKIGASISISGGSSVATYITQANESGTLPNSRRLVNGAGITLTDAGPGGTMTIAATAASPLTTKGDLWGFAAVDARFPVGADGYALIADSTQVLGVKYSPIGGGGVGPQMIFGDGSDGNLTAAAGTTTLTRDTYYNNVTLSGTAKINTAGFTLRIAGTLDITAAGASAIHCDGNNGSNGTAATGAGGPKGSALATSGLPNNGGGSAGANGGAGSIGSSSGNSTAINPGMGGQGGKGGLSNGTGGAAQGTVGAVTQWTGYPRFATAWPIGIAWTLSLNGTTISNTNPGAGQGGSGGSSGGVNGTSTGGGGGGAGMGGGTLALFARTIARSGATAASAISCRGGIGGNGAVGALGAGTGAGGGGGGGAGGGGWIWLVYESLTGSACTNCVDASGGVGGLGAAGLGAGTASFGGNAGDGGAAGTLQAFNLLAGTSTLINTHLAGSAGAVGVGINGGATGGLGGVAVLTL